MVGSRFISCPISILNSSKSSNVQSRTHSVTSNYSDEDGSLNYSLSQSQNPIQLDPSTTLTATQASISTASFSGSSSSNSSFILARFLPKWNQLELRFIQPISTSTTPSTTTTSSSFTPLLDSLPQSPPPQFFQFNTSIIPNISLIPDSQNDCLYVVLLSRDGILFRLRFNLPYLFNQTGYQSGCDYSYRINSLSTASGGGGGYNAVKIDALDAGLILVTLQDGAILKLEQNRSSSDQQGYQGPWRETLLKSNSFLSQVSFSRFFKSNPSTPTKSRLTLTDSTNSSSSSSILSLATFLQGDGPALAFCLTKDKKLKIWNLVSENLIRDVNLELNLIKSNDEENEDSKIYSEEDLSFDLTTSIPILKAYPISSDSILLLTYLPTVNPDGNLNFFSLYQIDLDSSVQGGGGGIGEVTLVWQERIDSEITSNDSKLVDFDFSSFTRGKSSPLSWKLMSLWEIEDGSSIKTIYLNEGYETIQSSSDSNWNTTLSSSSELNFSPLSGREFDSELTISQGKDSISDFFISKILEPNRFLDESLENSLEVYERDLTSSFSVSAGSTKKPFSLIKAEENRKKMSGDGFEMEMNLEERILDLVGCNVNLKVNDANGLEDYDGYRSNLIKEWLKFSNLLVNFESQARVPLGFLTTSNESFGDEGSEEVEPLIVTRELLQFIVKEDETMFVDRISTLLAQENRREEGRIESQAFLDKVTGSPNEDTTGDLSLVSQSEAQQQDLHQTTKFLSDNFSDRIHSTLKLSEIFSTLHSYVLHASQDSLIQDLFIEVRRFLKDAQTERLNDFLLELYEVKFQDSSLEETIPEIWKQIGQFSSDSTENVDLLRDYLQFLNDSSTISNLYSSQSSSNTSPVTSKELGSSLTSFYIIQSLQAKLSLTKKLFLFLFLTNSSEDFIDEMELHHLLLRTSDLVVKLELLLELSSFKSLNKEVDMMNLNVRDAAEEELDGDMVSKLNQLSVTGSKAKKETEGRLNGLSRNFIHLALNQRLISISRDTDADEDFESNLKEYETENGQLITSNEIFNASNWFATRSGLFSPSSETSDSSPVLNSQLAKLALDYLELGFPSVCNFIVESFKIEFGGRFLRALASSYLGRFEEARDDFLQVLRGIDQIGLDLAEEDDEEDEDEIKALSSVLPKSIVKQSDSASRRTRYYLFLSDLFETLDQDKLVTEFSQLALASSSTSNNSSIISTTKTLQLLFRLFRSYLSLGDFSSAYGIIQDSPSKPQRFLDFKIESIGRLVTLMTESGKVSELLSFNFQGLQAHVENTLAFKARNCNPLDKINYWKILYSYYLEKGDLKTAGMVMYQQARRLGDEQRFDLSRHKVLNSNNRTTGGGSGEREKEEVARKYCDLSQLIAFSYLASINALSLLDKEQAWFANADQPLINPTDDDEGMDMDDDDYSSPARVNRGNGGNGSRKLKSYIPEHHLQHKKIDLKPVRIEDVRREYELVMARLELVNKYPGLASTAFTLTPSDAVQFFIRDGHYDRAISIASSLGVDMTAIFLNLTINCVALERSYKGKKAALIDHLREISDASSSGRSTHPALCLTNEEELELELESYEDELDEDSNLNAIDVSFLKNSGKAISLDVDPDSPQYLKAWAYLKYNLDLKERDSLESFKHRLIVLERILDLQGVKSKEMIPEWLIDWFKVHRMDSLVRSFLKVGLIDDALEFAIDMVKNTPPTSSTTSAFNKSPTTWLPYNLLDELIVIAEDPETRPSPGSPSATKTREMVNVLKTEIGHRIERLKKEVKGLKTSWEEDRRREERRAEREMERMEQD